MLNFDKVKEIDPEIYETIVDEYNRQEDGLELIASENRPSEAVLQAQSSYHTLKYAEGYPGKRYYAGCRNIDKTEQLAIDRACQLFKCNYANVQPHSGANANLAVQFAFCKDRDTIMGMSLNSGGHLTHGAKPTISGKYFNSVQYEVDKETYLIDYDKLKTDILFYQPRLFIAGASAYPRAIDFKKIREIINDYNNIVWKNIVKTVDEDTYETTREEREQWYEESKCIFMVDMAHIAGLVAAGLHQNPCLYADVVTSTTHKTLRGPRGGLILWNESQYTKKINSAVFPGIQGGPLENIIAAKAVCFKEAMSEEFIMYQCQVKINADALAHRLKAFDFNVLTGGTDNHLILLDLRNKNITGQELESRLEEIHIITNKNAIPFDTEKKTITSGLRLGTPAITSRGFIEEDMAIIANLINSCIGPREEFDKNKETLQQIVKNLCNKYPLYKD